MENGKKIVVYGCDNTGKTTLCEMLREYIEEKEILVGNGKAKRRTIIAKSLGPNRTRKEYVDFMMENLANRDNVIFERFPIFEELVYGNLIRGRSVFSGYFPEIVDIFKMVDIFVFCYPGLINVLNFGEREQMDGVRENALDIINAFDRLTNFLLIEKFKVVEYNYTREGFGPANANFLNWLVNELGGIK